MPIELVEFFNSLFTFSTDFVCAIMYARAAVGDAAQVSAGSDPVRVQIRSGLRFGAV